MKKQLMLYRVCFLFFLFLIGVFYWRCASQHDRGGGGGVSSPSCKNGAAPLKTNNEFSKPERVTISGYTSHAMEPFITRDGNYLFFNSLNDGNTTSLCYATRVDDTTFTYVGAIDGVNGKAPHLDAVPSMDVDGRFYYVSKRSYNYDYATVYSGNFLNGRVLDVDVQPGNFYKRSPGWIVMDAEVNPDGTTMYYVNAHFNGGKIPDKADIGMARIAGGDFNVAANSREIMKRINTEQDLEYAPSITSDGLELFFTRFNECTSLPEILVAKRGSLSEPFRTPERIGVLTGFVEAPSITQDKKMLYYHQKVDGVFTIYKASR